MSIEILSTRMIMKGITSTGCRKETSKGITKIGLMSTVIMMTRKKTFTFFANNR